MIVKQTAPVHFLEGNCVINLNICPPGVGAEFTVESPLTLETYPIRHIGMNHAVFDYNNGTKETTEKGAIWPTPASVGITRWYGEPSVTETSRFYCVIPNKGFEVRYDERITISKGSSYSVNKGELLFVFGEDYAIDDNKYTTDNVFAISTHNRILTANSDIIITVLCTVPIIIEVV